MELEEDDVDWEHSSAKELFPIVYNELRRLAAARRWGDQAGESMQPTSLVHEAFIKLECGKQCTFRNRAHFLRIAGRVMRQVLVDRAREQLAAKRGNRPVKVTLSKAASVAIDWTPEITIALHDALTRFEAFRSRGAKVVELTCFAGLSYAETAEVLGVSPTTVTREWELARPWLERELERSNVLTDAAGQPRR